MLEERDERSKKHAIWQSNRINSQKKASNQTASRLYEIVNIINFSLYYCCDRYRPDTVNLMALYHTICINFSSLSSTASPESI